MNLKSIPPAERPRERLSAQGSGSLSTVELLAILLGHGTRERSVLELASDLLSHFGSLEALADATLEELTSIKGVGKAKAVQLKAAFALWKRLEEKKQGTPLDSPKTVYEMVKEEMAAQKAETLLILLRDVRRLCIHREILFKGTLTELLIHPREIFHSAIRHRAHSLIIAHNHPSGDPSPSAKDREMTQLLHAAGRIVGIDLADHLIIGRTGYFSFYEAGSLPKRAPY